MIKRVAIVEDDRGFREQLAQILGAARRLTDLQPYRPESGPPLSSGRAVPGGA
jgi:hypothetical protein